MAEVHMTAAPSSQDANPGPGSLDDLITRVKAVRDRASAINRDLKDVKSEQAELETAIMDAMDDQGIKMSGNHVAKVAINEETVPNIDDWELVYQFILDKANAGEPMFHLLYKQMSATVFRELRELGINIPGVKPFTKRKLSVTKSK